MDWQPVIEFLVVGSILVSLYLGWCRYSDAKVRATVADIRAKNKRLDEDHARGVRSTHGSK